MYIKENIMAGSNQGGKKGGNQGTRKAGNTGGNQAENKGANQGGNQGASSQSGDTSNRGFASMDPQKQREIAAEGGRAAHASGNAHEFTSEEAREAGAKSHQGDGNQQSGSESGRSGQSSGGKQGGGDQGSSGGSGGKSGSR